MKEEDAVNMSALIVRSLENLVISLTPDAQINTSQTPLYEVVGGVNTFDISINLKELQEV